jgi:hypothetical protein
MAKQNQPAFFQLPAHDREKNTLRNYEFILGNFQKHYGDPVIIRPVFSRLTAQHIGMKKSGNACTASKMQKALTVYAKRSGLFKG